VFQTHKLEVWPGFVSVVDTFEGGLLLQMDVTHRVLRTDSVFDKFKNLQKKSGTSFMSLAERMVIGESIVTKYNNKSYK